MNPVGQWKHRLGQLKLQSYAMYLAYRDPRTPWYARVLAAMIVGYAFSPIDLIPDFIPVLGYLDDLILLPLAIALTLRLIPAEVMAESRQRAQLILESDAPVSRVAAAVIVGIWVLLAVMGVLVLPGILA